MHLLGNRLIEQCADFQFMQSDLNSIWQIDSICHLDRVYVPSRWFIAFSCIDGYWFFFITMISDFYIIELNGQKTIHRKDLKVLVEFFSEIERKQFIVRHRGRKKASRLHNLSARPLFLPSRFLLLYVFCSIGQFQ